MGGGGGKPASVGAPSRPEPPARTEVRPLALARPTAVLRALRRGQVKVTERRRRTVRHVISLRARKSNDAALPLTGIKTHPQSLIIAQEK